MAGKGTSPLQTGQSAFHPFLMLQGKSEGERRESMDERQLPIMAGDPASASDQFERQELLHRVRRADEQAAEDTSSLVWGFEAGEASETSPKQSDPAQVFLIFLAVIVIFVMVLI